MATVNEKMTALADAIRTKSGVTGKLSLDDMKTAVDGIQVGSGGSGGGVETCTVTLMGDGPAPSGAAYYSDGTTVKEMGLPGMGSTIKLTVLKNTILVIEGFVSAFGGEAVHIISNGLKGYHITGDCRFTVE